MKYHNKSLSRILILVLFSFVVPKNSYSLTKFPLPDFITNIRHYINQSNNSIKIESNSQIIINSKKLDVISLKIISEVNNRNNSLKSLIILLKEFDHKEMTFNLLFSDDNKLIGIFPTTKDRAKLIGLRHINLSEYYLSLKSIKTNKWSQWERDLQNIKEFDLLVKNYCLKMGTDPDRDLMRTPTYDRKIWTCVEINNTDTTIKLMEFNIINFNESDKNKYFNKTNICFPILPTVFSPSKKTNLIDEQLTASLYYKSLHNINKLKKNSILEVGTGSGYYLWIAYKFSMSNNIKLNLFGIDINPIAVENAKILALIGGYSINVIAHNNIADKDGNLAFKNKKFEYVVWNMPQIPKNFNDSIILNEIEVEPTNSQVSYWDSGINGITALARFSKYLPKILTSNSIALIWNIIPDSGVDVVKNTFEQYNFSVKKLDKHYSEYYKETTIVYELRP